MRVKTLTMSKWTPSTWHANAQEFFPRNPPREQLASIGGNTNAASWYPEPMFLDDAYAVPGLRKGQRDGESSEPCQSISCIRPGCALTNKLCKLLTAAGDEDIDVRECIHAARLSEGRHKWWIF